MTTQLFNDSFLLITCSLCAKVEDRLLDRHKLQSVQILHQGKFKPVNFLNNIGPLGISSFDWKNKTDNEFYGSSGDDLFKIDIKSGAIEKIEVENLKDVHEIRIQRNSLWLSNTGKDECIEIDLSNNKVIQRISLNSLLKPSLHIDNSDDPENKNIFNEKFHCNQVFFDLNGAPLTLTHHVTGKQLLKRIAQKLLKTHGNGGVINLETKKIFNLKLDAPHNVRTVNNQYWVCNSGRSSISLFDPDWNFISKFDTRGWARGFAISKDKNYAFIGISATRKRYLNNKDQVPNMIEVFDTNTHESLAHFEIPNVEQVNNVYLISEDQANSLLSL